MKTTGNVELIRDPFSASSRGPENGLLGEPDRRRALNPHFLQAAGPESFPVGPSLRRKSCATHLESVNLSSLFFIPMVGRRAM
jgi:hypothetical protein